MAITVSVGWFDQLKGNIIKKITGLVCRIN